jgi:hypothetical protein
MQQHLFDERPILETSTHTLHMKALFTLFFFFAVFTAPAQEVKGYSVIDFVRIKDSNTKEALYFYENNWKLYRDIALQKGYIKSYQLVRTQPSPTTPYHLLLITEYSDSAQFAVREERFNALIKEVRPDGPKLLNHLKPAEFRETVNAIITETLWQPR